MRTFRSSILQLLHRVGGGDPESADMTHLLLAPLQVQPLPVHGRIHGRKEVMAGNMVDGQEGRRGREGGGREGGEGRRELYHCHGSY